MSVTIWSRQTFQVKNNILESRGYFLATILWIVVG